jgi:hypothetical protein
MSLFLSIRFMISALAVATAILAAGCHGTMPAGSQTYEKPAAPVDELRLLYLHNVLGSTQPSRNPLIRHAEPWELGYHVLPGMIEARAPKVMATNGISAVAKSARRYGLTPSEARDALAADGSQGRVKLLTLQVLGGNSTANTAGASSVRLKMQADLFDESWGKRLWSADFELMVGQSRSLGLSNGVDERFVDDMVGKVIEQLRQDGFVRIAAAR